MKRTWLALLGVVAMACSSRGDGSSSQLLGDASADADAAPSNDLFSGADLPPPPDVAMDASMDAAGEASMDAAGEASMDASEAAAPGCRTNADCPSSLVCSALLRRCTDCTSDVECPSDRPVCRGGVCSAATACMSSRMCPGGVCDTRIGSCVECASDVDCGAGQRCVAHACVATTECRSSAQCSALSQVCDPVAGRCVDCVADGDCGAGQYCAAGGLCRRGACVPGSMTCLDPMTARVCDARGAAAMNVPCPAGQSCMAGRCMMRACTPGAAECVDATRRRVCNADGFGYGEPATCPSGQVCRAGMCGMGCTPGQPVDCADASAVRVCGSDGVTLSSMVCISAPNAMGACSSGRCINQCLTGFGDCDGNVANGCETNTRTSASHCGACGRACAAGQACSNGACVTAPALCPPSCRANADCDPCRMPGDVGQYCCISGLCLYTTATCGGTDAGVADVGDVGAGYEGQPCLGGSCGAGLLCSGGVCARQTERCPTGTVDCASGSAAPRCVNLATDSNNCGACNTLCSSGLGCLAGRCVGTCAGSGYTICGTRCVNATSDPANCGTCGRACTASQECLSGTCTNRCGTSTSTVWCAVPGACTDLTSDRNHCGRCGLVCPTGYNCVGGVCRR